jgi:hypothetical protein
MNKLLYIFLTLPFFALLYSKDLIAKNAYNKIVYYPKNNKAFI